MNKNLKNLHFSGIAEVVEKASKVKDSIHLETGDIDKDPPIEAVKYLKEGYLQHQCHYPPLLGNEDLREALFEFERIDKTKEDVIITSGGSMGIWLSLNSILNPGDNVVLFGPFWPHFNEMIKMNHANPVVVDLEKESFRLNKNELFAINKEIKAILLCCPNNPTGTIFTKEELKHIIEFARRNDAWIIYDAEYEVFCYDSSFENIVYENYEKIITSKSISKTFAAAGLRLGYLFGNKEIIQEIKKLTLFTIMYPNSLMQYYLYKLIKEKSDFPNMLKEVMERRVNNCLDILRTCKNISVKKPDGGLYLWINCKHFNPNDEAIDCPSKSPDKI